MIIPIRDWETAQATQEVQEIHISSERFRCANELANIAGFALSIIGCIGAAGAFPGSTIGWVTVGLAGCIIPSFALATLKTRKCQLISGVSFLVLATIGILGGVGALSAYQVGWGIIGVSLAPIFLYSLYVARERFRGPVTSFEEL